MPRRPNKTVLTLVTARPVSSNHRQVNCVTLLLIIISILYYLPLKKKKTTLFGSFDLLGYWGAAAGSSTQSTLFVVLVVWHFGCRGTYNAPFTLVPRSLLCLSPFFSIRSVEEEGGKAKQSRRAGGGRTVYVDVRAGTRSTRQADKPSNVHSLLFHKDKAI